MKKLNITFCSSPDYTGNAKALYVYMQKHYKNKMNLTWIVHDESKQKKLNEKGIKAILIGTPEFKKYIKTTNVFFTTHCNLTGDITKKSLYVELWHGISSKKIGFMMNHISDDDKNWYKEISRKIDYIIVPSEFWKIIFAARFNLDLRQILPIGYPKLDNIKDENAKTNLEKILNCNIEEYKKIIFYTPTFRKGCGRKSDSHFGSNIINLNKYEEEELIEIFRVLFEVCRMYKQEAADLATYDEDILYKEFTKLPEGQEESEAADISADVIKSFMTEQSISDMIRRGSKDEFLEWTAHAPTIKPGIIIKNAIRQAKNMFIVSTALFSRAAIRGGMDTIDALKLSDSYIMKCEQLTTPLAISNLQFHMVLDYVENVEKVRYHRNKSEFVGEVANYVRHHLSEPIKTEDIADALFISRSRLSTKFKEESGITLTEYIRNMKISEAKHLLKHTDKSLLLISTHLGFSSQSHFCKVFKEVTGMSPSEFKET